MKHYRVVADRLREEEVDGEALLSLTQVEFNNQHQIQNQHPQPIITVH